MSPIPSNRYAEAIFAIGIIKKLQGKNARGFASTPPGRPRVNTVRDLGVMLDSKMTMSQHVSRVCQNCYFQIRLIRRLGKALSVESKLLLVHALVHSRLDYCNSVLVRLPWSLVQQLQSVLNSAACLIFGLKRFDHITPALMDLHWLPYPQRITYKLCMIMCKCLRGSAPAYLADYCTSTSLVPGRSALRSAAHGDIVVPSHRTDWGLRSFAVAGPSSWNALPVDLRSSSFGLDTFAKHLKHIYLVLHTHDRVRTFEFVSHFVECDTVTVSPNQIIIIIIHLIRLKVKEKQESNPGRQSDDRMGENLKGKANLKRWVLSFERNVETDNELRM